MATVASAVATLSDVPCCHSLHRSSAATVQSGGRNGIDTAESDDSYATGNCARLGKAASSAFGFALLQHARPQRVRLSRRACLFVCMDSWRGLAITQECGTSRRPKGF
jgi:hypothetical protein